MAAGTAPPAPPAPPDRPPADPPLVVAEPPVEEESETPTSCLCRALEGELHDTSFCDLRPFPGPLRMTPARAQLCNELYRASYGKLVDGEVAVHVYRSDCRVFPCACGCGARVAISGLLWAFRPWPTWWIAHHAPAGVVHRGRRYVERGEA